jgi:hypothetical protein
MHMRVNTYARQTMAYGDNKIRRFPPNTRQGEQLVYFARDTPLISLQEVPANPEDISGFRLVKAYRIDDLGDFIRRQTKDVLRSLRTSKKARSRLVGYLILGSQTEQTRDKHLEWVASPRHSADRRLAPFTDHFLQGSNRPMDIPICNHTQLNATQTPSRAGGMILLGHTTLPSPIA